MILDELNEFADAVALNTGVAGDYLVGDVIDLGAAPTLQDVGLGEDLYVVVQIDTTATSGGAATGAFSLASDSTANLATSPTKHVTSAAHPVASLVAGFTALAVKLPAGSYERYLGIIQTTGTAAFTAGKINAFLTKDFAKFVALPNAVGA